VIHDQLEARPMQSPWELDQQCEHINFLCNVARIYHLDISWSYRRKKDSTGAENLWHCTLFVDSVMASTGVGRRKVRAKDEAARQYLIVHGYRLSEPLSAT